MAYQSNPRADAESSLLTPAARADRLRGVSLWLSQLDRAVRNCLLYGLQSAAIVRIRAQLAESLIALLRRFEPLRIGFSADAVSLEGDTVPVEQSLKDGIVGLLHRDGIRGLTLHLGVEAAEVDALLDALVRASGPGSGESDLVTVLWEADLGHVDVDSAPLEAEFVADADGESEDLGPLLPWPGSGVGANESDGGTAGALRESAETTSARSDDWTVAPNAPLVGAAVVGPGLSPPPDAERLRAAYEKEQGQPLLRTALETARACLAATGPGEESQEIEKFLLRVIRQAVLVGDWAEGTDAVKLLTRTRGEVIHIGEVGRDILASVSIPEIVRTLDGQPVDEVKGFVGWARELGDAAPEWIFHAMSESQERRYRRLFAQALAETCRENVGVLAAWLSDSRWYVVRNLVFVLGLIGGDTIGPLVRQVVGHAERRVRRQCLVALGTMSPRAARPILLRLLSEADPDQFRGALDLLVAQKDPESARGILEVLMAPDAALRPEDQRVALAGAVGSAGGELILPLVERLFAGSSWICRHPAACQALTASLAKAQAPGARALLERGAQSRNGTVRSACASALGSIENAH